MANPYLTFNGFNVRTSSNVRIVSPFYPIPPYTMRFQFDDGFDPNSLLSDSTEYIGSWTNVAGSVWDFTYQNERWYAYGYSQRGALYMYSILSIKTKEIVKNGLYQYDDTTTSLFGYSAKVLGANLTGVRYLNKTFYNWGPLKSIAYFDTSMLYNAGELVACNNKNRAIQLESIPDFNFSSVTNESLTWNGNRITSGSPKAGLASFAYAGGAAAGMTKLKAVPNLTIPNATDVNVSYMFGGNKMVESGTLALYNKFSTANWQGTHNNCFSNCGSSTTTGAAELAQIPTGWGGTMSA